MLLIINPEYAVSIYSQEIALPLFLLFCYFLLFSSTPCPNKYRIYSGKIPTVFCPLEEEEAPWTEGKNVLETGEHYWRRGRCFPKVCCCGS